MLMMAMLVLAAGTPVASSAAPAAPAGVPAEIERHYREYNFVNAFSTRGERTSIAYGRPRTEPRLERIARAMKRIAARIEDVDPGMIVGSPSVSETAMRSDLVRVVSWRTDKDGDEAWATLDVSALDAGTGAVLLTKFDELAKGDSAPPLDEILAAAPARPAVHTTEVHHWFRIDGTWRRDAATRHFLTN